jgi:hypothetical protein
MAGTIARRPVLSAVRCLFRKCPRAGNATTAPASSSHRPTGQNARSPRRRRPNRSADGGSCNRPVARACAGKSRSSRARHCAGVAELNWRSRGNAIGASWTVCCNHVRKFARFLGTEPAGVRICATVGKILHVLSGSAAKVLWTIRIRTVIFHNAGVTESFGVERGPLPLAFIRVCFIRGLGKEPI